MKPGTIDFAAVFSANFFNLLMVGIMLSRLKGQQRLERFWGMIGVTLIFPLFGVFIYNIYAARDLWKIFLPGLFIVFLLVEWGLDYVLKYPFRQSRWLGAYLLLFYLAQWGMIGYGFISGPIAGYVTLVTYFLSLGATAYSYKKVGHGIQNHPGV